MNRPLPAKVFTTASVMTAQQLASHIHKTSVSRPKASIYADPILYWITPLLF